MQRKNAAYTLAGRISNLDGAPLQGLTVYAYDQDPKTPADPLGKPATTNADGYYEIKFSEADFVLYVENRGPDIFIRVYDGDALLGESPVYNNSPTDSTINLQVAYLRVESGEPARLVFGTVNDAGGCPLYGLMIRVLDRDLRYEQLLGLAQTDANGRYEVRYFRRQFRKREKGSADLVVRVFAADGRALLVSPVWFTAPESLKLNLTIPADVLTPLSLYEKIAQTLPPLLEDIAVIDLEQNERHQDLSFLAGETGLEQPILARFALAHRLAQHELEPEFWFAVLGAGGHIFQYASDQSIEQQSALLIASLPTLSTTTVRKALLRGFNERDIPTAMRANLDDWMGAFQKYGAERLLIEHGHPTFVQQAVRAANVKSRTKLNKFARVFKEYNSLTPELINKLETDRVFNKTELADLRTFYDLAALMNGNTTIVGEIKERFNVREPQQIRHLARIGDEEWLKLVADKHADGTLELPTDASDSDDGIPLGAETYARTLARPFREAFPTAAFTGSLERALQKDDVRGLHHGAELRQFLDAHENFELLHTPIDDFLENSSRRKFRALARDDNFRLEMKAVQRVFRLNPSFEAANTLLADNIHSAQKIYHMGESEFVRRYADTPGFTAESARRAWNRAADTYSTVLTMVGDVKAMEYGAMPTALKSSANNLARYPNWNSLFNIGDICECDECRSVLSPAAYFADLLEFLSNRSSLVGTTARDVLLQRRPDLGYLELNCENAKVPLPYIDVVCEVLEAVIAGDEMDTELVGFRTIPADPLRARDMVRSALGKFAGIDVGADVTLGQSTYWGADRWIAHGSNATILLKKKQTQNFFAEILRNTKTSAAELRAYPQYVNPAAYRKLREARYPFTLPFDLYVEEVRAAFQKINIKRWELMETFVGPNPPNDIDSADIAAEYFGISTTTIPVATNERSLITLKRTTDAELQEVWGETGYIGWLITLQNVKTFLQKTGLEYDELLTLMSLPFINPDGDIYVSHIDDPTCDTNKKTIVNLDAAALDRIHRFLRLWRKLKNWQMWELDLVIRHKLGGGVIDDKLLVHLFYVCRIKEKLGKSASVEHVLALFGNLNTETHFTKLYDKRGDGLYQKLFLNRLMIQPLDPAFDVFRVTNPTSETISGHQSAVLATLGVRESDLAILQNMTRTNGTAYIDDDLLLVNLSFLWRHAWLSKTLKFKLQEWVTLLKLLQLDIKEFPQPDMLWTFLTSIDHIKSSAFSVDELDWLLTANRLAKAAVKETEAARFLLMLRKDIQSIRATYDAAQFDFLSDASDVDQIATLLSSLLQNLNRDSAGVQGFLQTLRGSVMLEAATLGLPDTFAFPAAITGNIPIQYDAANERMRFTGLMLDAQRDILLDGASPALASLDVSARLQADAPNLPAGYTFDPAITGNIPIQYDEPNERLEFTGLMTPTQRNALLDENEPSLAAVLTVPEYRSAVDDLYGQSTTMLSRYRSAIEELYQRSLNAPLEYVISDVQVNLPNGITLPGTMPSLPISYNEDTQTLSFLGVMTAAEQAAVHSVAANADAEDAIDELFALPRLALKFYEPVFTTPLDVLPAGIDFKTLPASLAAKVAYDPELRLLRFTGVMSAAEKARLDALAAGNAGLLAAIASIAAQIANAAPPGSVWLTDAALDSAQPASDTFAKRLANAASKALAYLSTARSARAIVEQFSTQLGLTEALTRHLLTKYPVLPETLMEHFTDAFADTTAAVDYATMKPSFDAWYWAKRVSALWNRWKLTFDELEKIIDLTATAKLLDFGALPLDDADPPAPFDEFLRTSRLLRLRDALPETDITLLELLEKLNTADYVASASVQGLPAGFIFQPPIAGAVSISYDEPHKLLHFDGIMTINERSLLLNEPTLAAVSTLPTYRNAIDTLFGAFVADVEKLNERWLAADVKSLFTSLDIDYPADYLLAENWERVAKAFTFIDSLNASAEAVKAFAAAEMTDQNARRLNELLRSKFGSETWLTLSTEIQDVVRERKRDALAAYILNMRMPIDAPSGKWENTNDLYAYYLLDIEMASCQLTSRLVQGSGSIQLFVQRCFMGLEPAVIVNAEFDTAWRWWDWMRKYRVWEANRKVFLFPENWIEPELKQDRSSFLRELEDELMQNDVNQINAEAAFANYLDKLNDVAQLEIAGFYQEDDDYDTILHVFARTTGAEPHHYFYRRYNYRQWTPWERVEVDIQGDHLIPVVINKRVFLFWPIFTEVQDEAQNMISKVPRPGDTQATLDKAKKKVHMYMAVSEYRQGRWTPKKVSKQYAESINSHTSELITRYYRFFPVDKTSIGGSFVINYQGFNLKSGEAGLYGDIEIFGCNGAQDMLFIPDDGFALHTRHVIQPEENSVGIWPTDLKWLELPRDKRFDKPENDFTLDNFAVDYNVRVQQLLQQTPDAFVMSPAWHLSYMDKFLLHPNRYPYAGMWLPFFYNDNLQTFIALPSYLNPNYYPSPIRQYYPELKTEWLPTYTGIEVQIGRWAAGELTSQQRNDLIVWLSALTGVSLQPPPPPATEAQFIRQVVETVRDYFYNVAAARSADQQYHFKYFYHSFACDFGRILSHPLQGVNHLMRRETQYMTSDFSFSQTYVPTSRIVGTQMPDYYPVEAVDFSLEGAYSSYNWEVFFHVPLFIANSLSRNQRFEEARRWYHYIFNPVGVESAMPGGDPMSKFWITRPFFETTAPDYLDQRIDTIIRILAGDTTLTPIQLDLRNALEEAVTHWKDNPFEPHRIALYRTVAYQKNVFMKYLDNLIAWGDNLFRQDSMESINEATQLYVLAAELLGKRPDVIPPKVKPPIRTYNELEPELESFSNPIIQVENIVPMVSSGGATTYHVGAPLPTLYFCIPQNDKLLTYWDTVEDRLYKIRNCMNIDGVVRQLSLFEPPIDAGALVAAVAGGAGIGAALADLNAPLPLYRFNLLLQKANELCADLKALGGSLLAALEKKDAEEMSRLRQRHEIRVLDAITALREQQIEEAKENKTALERSKITAQTRRDYYNNIQKIITGEQLSLNKQKVAFDHQNKAQTYSIAGSIIGYLPNITIGGSGFGGSPHVNAQWGTGNIISALQAMAGAETQLSNAASFEAGRSSTLAGYERRFDDWKLQAKLAQKEMDQLDSQIESAQIRIDNAQKELDNHRLQIDNAKAMDAFMRSKYTNQELYQWQMGQLSGVYFQSYRMAYDLAKAAERCLRFELGLQEGSYINFGYWDSLRKGLLAGEQLQVALRRLETAYMEKNRREFELTKHVSLAMLDPLALIQLRETGRCFLDLPEEIFDLDYPGHYFRRIKSASITLPCVIGPYTTIACTVRLLKNSIRINTGNGSGDDPYARNTDDSGLPADDMRFVENNIPVRAIAASSGQNDSGMFELQFRDERYLPFEGAGVISRWSLELFNDLPSNNPDFGRPLRQFDYDTISDAILHIKYTAREDAGGFKNRAVTHLRNYFDAENTTPSLRLFDLREEFPMQWQRFLNPTNAVLGNVFEIDMASRLFPQRDANNTLKVNSIWLLARCADGGAHSVTLNPPLSAPPPSGADVMNLVPVAQFGGLHYAAKNVADLAEPIVIAPNADPLKWRLTMTRPGGGNLLENPLTHQMEIEDLYLVLGYEWQGESG